MKDDNLKNVFRLDSIRIMKMIEICQFTLIGMILGILNAQFISRYILIDFDEDNYVTEEYPKEKGNRNPLLWFHLLIDICVITITTYYLKKIARLIPFGFGFLNKKYISGLKGESATGFSVGIGFVYLRLLVNFQSRMDLLLTSIKTTTKE